MFICHLLIFSLLLHQTLELTTQMVMKETSSIQKLKLTEFLKARDSTVPVKVTGSWENLGPGTQQKRARDIASVCSEVLKVFAPNDPQNAVEQVCPVL